MTTNEQIERAAKEIAGPAITRHQEYERAKEIDRVQQILSRHFAPGGDEVIDRDRYEKLLAYAIAFEKWEGDMILDNEAWKGGMAPLPTLTYPLWDRLLELQAMRNEALKGIPVPEPKQEVQSE